MNDVRDEDWVALFVEVEANVLRLTFMPESAAPCSTATMPLSRRRKLSARPRSSIISVVGAYDGITRPHDGLRSDDPNHIGSQVTSELIIRHYDIWQCITGAYDGRVALVQFQTDHVYLCTLSDDGCIAITIHRTAIQLATQPWFLRFQLAMVSRQAPVP